MRAAQHAVMMRQYHHTAGDLRRQSQALMEGMQNAQRPPALPARAGATKKGVEAADCSLKRAEDRGMGKEYIMAACFLWKAANSMERTQMLQCSERTYYQQLTPRTATPSKWV